MKRRIILCAAMFMAAMANTFACTNLIVGKNASADGSTIVSYSADSYRQPAFYATRYEVHKLHAMEPSYHSVDK